MTPGIAKPLRGAPCTRCGYCCAMERCLISVWAFGEGPGPCPALEYDGPVAVCGVVRDVPAFIQPRIAAALGLGVGCDSPDDDESINWNRRVGSAASGSTP